MKTWNLRVNEEELKALINYHACQMTSGITAVETSSRIHDLTKRLNKTDAEITKEDEPKAEVEKSIWPAE